MDMKQCKSCTLEKETDKFRKSSNKCKACENQGRKDRYIRDRENILLRNKEKYIANKEIICKKNKEYIDNNKEIVAERMKIYQQKNKEKINAYRKQYMRERKANDPIFKIQALCRTRIYKLIKNINKTHKSSELLDCSMEHLKAWFEFNFDDKMTWENQGQYWHIDHIIPCASFDLTKEKELKECFNWKNLRPCEKINNICKGDKIDKNIISEFKTKVQLFEKSLKVIKS